MNGMMTERAMAGHICICYDKEKWGSMAYLGLVFFDCCNLWYMSTAWTYLLAFQELGYQVLVCDPRLEFLAF